MSCLSKTGHAWCAFSRRASTRGPGHEMDLGGRHMPRHHPDRDEPPCARPPAGNDGSGPEDLGGHSWFLVLSACQNTARFRTRSPTGSSGDDAGASSDALCCAKAIWLGGGPGRGRRRLLSRRAVQWWWERRLMQYIWIALGFQDTDIPPGPLSTDLTVLSYRAAQ